MTRRRRSGCEALDDCYRREGDVGETARMAKDLLTRRDFVRPIVAAIFFTLVGEILIFFIWGIALFPAGPLWRKLGWTMTCGVAMGATIGALVNVFVTGRLRSSRAAVTAGVIYFSVLAFCTALCYQVDLSVDYFGAREAPVVFVLGGLIPAFLTSIAYAWLLYSVSGQSILSRVHV